LDLLLEEALTRSPGEFGYPAAHWSAPLLGEHLSRLRRTAVSDETIRRRLRWLGYQWAAGHYARAAGTEPQPTDPAAAPVGHALSFREREAMAA
jgi:hypothetical protein